jgi:voltage-gated potassium channel
LIEQSIVQHPAQHAGFITRHRFVVLFFSLLTFFVLVPLVHQLHEDLAPAAPPLVESCAFVLVLGGTVASVSGRRSRRLLAGGLALPTALLVVVHNLSDAAWITILHHLFAGVFLVYAIVVMLRYVFTTQRVTSNTVFASLGVYLLLALTWALAYSLVHRLDPAAFYSSVPSHQSPLVLRVGRGQTTGVLYFSFVTLTTLGYGDIVPTSPVARMLASVEAITGQLYLTVLVARLVGLHISESLEQEPKTPERDPSLAEEPSKR